MEKAKIKHSTVEKRMRTFYRDIFASLSETMRSNREEHIKSGQNLGEEVAEKAEEDENERVVQHHEESCRPVSPIRVRTISPLLVFLLSTHLRQTLMRVLLSLPRSLIKFRRCLASLFLGRM
ncbi:hypothetical protein MA16_Dca010818 [Dendrobium catenatum]|uniref:Uncharacterized protein n=1 Tax=Dendrobium catenatum TaxID=906689 RepID=A0A2I0W5A5_9ASPA|nr:hypothetical protein MA16_Dca010818 [Dendrobium catenatum]